MSVVPSPMCSIWIQVQKILETDRTPKPLSRRNQARMKPASAVSAQGGRPSSDQRWKTQLVQIYPLLARLFQEMQTELDTRKYDDLPFLLQEGLKRGLTYYHDLFTTWSADRSHDWTHSLWIVRLLHEPLERWSQNANPTVAHLANAFSHCVQSYLSGTSEGSSWLSSLLFNVLKDHMQRVCTLLASVLLQDGNQQSIDVVFQATQTITPFLQSIPL